MSDDALNNQNQNIVGVDSDTGILTDVLLGSTADYQWRRSISVITERTFDANLEFDHSKAKKQHEELVDLFEGNGVRCHFLGSQPELPYCVFARDASFMTPFGPVISLMMNPVRRGDYVVALEFYRNAGFPIWKMVSAGHCEGGDVAIIEPGSVIIGYGGLRSDEAGATQVVRWFEEEGWEGMAVPFASHLIHLDLTFAMVAPKLAVMCIEAHQPQFVDWLRSRRVELITISYGEAMNCGCNLFSLGNDRVLSTSQNQSVNERLRSFGLTVLEPDLSMFTLGGGGPHCLTQALRREPEQENAG